MEVVFKYEIGQWVLQRGHGGELEEAQILERTIINGNLVYKTSLIGQWENECFIK
jgi:hypothetical protein